MMQQSSLRADPIVLGTQIGRRKSGHQREVRLRVFVAGHSAPNGMLGRGENHPFRTTLIASIGISFLT